MQITVNGQGEQVPEGLTVADLVARMGLEPLRVAVERNRRLCPRRSHAETYLAEGDVLEVVTLVGGG